VKRFSDFIFFFDLFNIRLCGLVTGMAHQNGGLQSSGAKGEKQQKNHHTKFSVVERGTR